VPGDPSAVCIVGAARHTWREQPAPEPLDMWEAVARSAAADAGAPNALRDLESLQVVYCQAWEYDDAPLRLAERLGAAPAHRRYSGIGGSVPLSLVADAADAMARGELDLALVVGAEALATRKKVPDPAWSFPPEEARRFPITIDRAEAANGIFQAYLTFALLDTARRVHLGRDLAEHRKELGQLFAPLSEVAAAQPDHAWFPVAHDASEIVEVTSSNRMVATPYTKLMTAFMDVDMAAAVLLATDARADALGVPADRRVYLRGFGSADEPFGMAERPELWHAPAMEVAMRRALRDRTVEDVAHLDLYSCFGSSLAFASDALGLREPRSLTVTGALPYHGGPGSNYTTHAMAAMTDVLRADPGSFGLVSGVSMHMAGHAASLWSTTPGPAPRIEAGPSSAAVPVTAHPEGPAKVATFSTTYGREGPEWTALICDLRDGSRCYARLEEAVPDDVDLAGAEVTVVAGERGANTARL
jgi:acetyl-CoA C-acetyltransferase